MSRGIGLVQRRIKDAFESNPGKAFTIVGLAEIAFPGQTIERKHKQSVRRALSKLISDARIAIYQCSVGHSHSRGWFLSMTLD
jgi:hypothetical protein